MSDAYQRFFAAIAFVGAGFLSGCATLGPVYQPESNPPADNATIYAYREFNPIGGAATYVVRANGAPLGRLPSGGYFVHHALPGEVEFSASTVEATTSVTVDAKAGEVYYIKGSFGIGLVVGHPHLVLVSKEVGQKEIASCKRVADSDMFAPDIAWAAKVTVPTDEGATRMYKVHWYSGVDYLSSFSSMADAEQWEVRGALALTDRSLTLVLQSDPESQTAPGLRILYSDIASIEVSSIGLNRAVVVKRRDNHLDSFQVRGLLVDRQQTQEAADLLRSRVEAQRASTSK